MINGYDRNKLLIKTKESHAVRKLQEKYLADCKTIQWSNYAKVAP